MAAVKKFFAGRGLGYWLSLAALVLGFVALGLYYNNGINEFTTKLNGSVIAGIWAAAALCVVALAVDIKPLRYISYFLYLYAFMGFIYSQVNYIANVFVAIDGNTFTAGFIATAVCLVLAFGIRLAAAITTNVAPWKKGGAAPAEAEEEVMKDD